ncbi:hypothetical protein O181_094995 [Austropuccinia psidii MF-1]|uniref:Uncharacterized protein n=1 Tax=Austropuccinia psidii MF-1 TaxID=1389203 RepID=A0A9Q3J4Q8_9BASI|nr:hypothetical protein [Austropuccinia psidii MF-1]
MNVPKNDTRNNEEVLIDLKLSQQDVGTYCVLVRCINSRRGITSKISFGPNLPSKHSVGHILNPCLLSSAFFQLPRITNGILYPYAHFVNHSGCHQNPYNTLVLGTANHVTILSVTSIMKVLIIETLLLQ